MMSFKGFNQSALGILLTKISKTGVFIKPHLQMRELYAMRCLSVCLFDCLFVCLFVRLSLVKSVKSFATWQHLAASGGFLYRL